MKKLLLLLIALPIFFSSCKDDNNDPIPPSNFVKDSDAFIINYGSYTTTEGSITGLNTTDSKVYNYLFETINGPAMKGKPQYAYQYDEKIFFMGNNLDEIFYVNDSTLIQSTTGVTNDIIKPRYCVAKDNYLYISCYGGEVWKNTSLGYIAKFNIQSNSIEKIIDLPGGPEGLEIVGNQLYCALNYTNKIAIMDLDSDTFTYIEDLPAVSTYFLKDNKNNLYVSQVPSYTPGVEELVKDTGLGYINTSNNTLESMYSLSGISSNYSSIMSFNSNESKIYVAASSWVEETPGDWVQKGSLMEFDVKSQSFDFTPFIPSLDGLNGVTVNPKTDEVYVMISQNTTSSGELRIYDNTGGFLENHNTGIAPAWVLFK